MTCKTCDNTGVVTWTENQSPLDSGYTWLETFTDYCEDCTGKGICPNCGAELAEAADLDNFNNPYFATCKCGFADPLRG